MAGPPVGSARAKGALNIEDTEKIKARRAKEFNTFSLQNDSHTYSCAENHGLMRSIKQTMAALTNQKIRGAWAYEVKRFDILADSLRGPPGSSTWIEYCRAPLGVWIASAIQVRNDRILDDRRPRRPRQSRGTVGGRRAPVLPHLAWRL